MSPAKNSALRLTIYGLFIAYLLGDLFVFNGPIARKIDLGNPFSEASIAKSKAEGVVAQVFNHKITRSMLDRAVAERLWLSGKSESELTPATRKITRYAALNDLIDHEILRVKAKVNAYTFPATDEEIDARLEEFSKRFSSREVMLRAMQSQGVGSVRDLRNRLGARIQQEKYVAAKIEPLTEVSEADAKAWFTEHHRHLDIPERIRVRHIFLPSLNQTREQSVPKLKLALEQLAMNPQDFTQLAADLSEDPATRDLGGMLGWITRSRLPADFTKPLFEMPVGTPQIIETKIGWHLVEVLERRAATPQAFADVKTDVMAALQTVHRRKAIHDYRQALRRYEGHRVQIFHDMVQE